MSSSGDTPKGLVTTRARDEETTEKSSVNGGKQIWDCSPQVAKDPAGSEDVARTTTWQRGYPRYDDEEIKGNAERITPPPITVEVIVMFIS